LSDFYPHGNVAQCYGVLRSEGYSERAIFVIDKKGIIRYVDVHAIDQQPDNEELFRVLAQIEPFVPRANAVVPAVASSAVPASEPSSDVVMYCTSWCPECRRARAYFKEKGIPLVEINISQDRAAAERVRGWAKGFETTPTFTVKGQAVVGFDRVKIEQILG
jgi:glutaredoxin